MTNPMIERVARAICNVHGIDPDGKFKSSNDGPGTAPHLLAWHDFQPEARAAIKAMREPTPEILAAGHSAGDDETGYVEYFSPEAFYHGIIDAALKED
jgi:hypothetical protein